MLSIDGGHWEQEPRTVTEARAVTAPEVAVQLPVTVPESGQNMSCKRTSRILAILDIQM